MDKMIYFDNAATSFPKPDAVMEAVVEGLQTLGNAGRGLNPNALSAMRIIYNTREKLAQLFGVEDPSRIAFTGNATESLNLAIKGLLGQGDHAITTILDHNSVLRPLYQVEADGLELTILDSDNNGTVDYQDFEKAIRANTKAIVCAHGSNVTGNCIDIKRVGEITKEHGILFIVDASQTAGILDIDVEEMQIDVLCFTGHKGLLGPQGTGGIYVREGVEIPAWKVGGSGMDSYNKKYPTAMPTALEGGTLNSHGIAGLRGALTYIEEVGIEKIREKELELMWQFYYGVKDIPGVKIYGDFQEVEASYKTDHKRERCAIVSLNIGDYDSAAVSDELLTTYGISTRSGAHCAPLMHEALGTVEQGAVRFSFSHFNTIEEIDMGIKAIKELSS